MIRPLFLDTAALVTPLLASDRLAARWSGPSALEKFPVSGLAGHLARSLFTTETALEGTPPAGVRPVDAIEYYLAGDLVTDVDAEVPQLIRDAGQQEASTGPDDLRERFEAALTRVSARLPAEPAGRLIEFTGTYGTSVLPLDEWLLTRLIEFTVHLDDLAVSLDLPTPEVPPAAADLVVATLAKLSRARHGTLPLIRALARVERAGTPVPAF